MKYIDKTSGYTVDIASRRIIKRMMKRLYVKGMSISDLLYKVSEKGVSGDSYDFSMIACEVIRGK